MVDFIFVFVNVAITINTFIGIIGSNECISVSVCISFETEVNLTPFHHSVAAVTHISNVRGCAIFFLCFIIFIKIIIDCSVEFEHTRPRHKESVCPISIMERTACEVHICVIGKIRIIISTWERYGIIGVCFGHTDMNRICC